MAQTIPAARKSAVAPLVVQSAEYVSSNTFEGKVVALDGTVYDNVTVTKADPESLTIEYSPQPGCFGVAKVKLANMPRALQDKYNYDPAKAEAFKAQRTSEVIAYFNAKQAELEQKTREREERTNTLKRIVIEYHKKHLYLGREQAGENIYVCGDMACDLWDQVIAKGFKARLCVGNVDSDVTKFFEANHVWVLAEVLDRKVVALEATGGFIVPKEKNERYYRGWEFSTPAEFKECLALRRSFNSALDKWRGAITSYNEVFTRYKNADELSKTALLPDLERVGGVLKSRKADFDEVNAQLSSLLAREKARIEGMIQP